jgi:hypothetical protein
MLDTAHILPVFLQIVFNIPVLLLAWRLPLLADLRQALKEKDPIGGATDTTSYSRVTGLVGAVVLTAFFWAISNIVIFKAFTTIGDIKLVTDGSYRLFIVGAALFLPYAFNQIKSAFGASATAAASAVAGAPGVPVPNAGPPQLKLVIANISTQIDDATFAAAVAAIQVQVNRDFQPEWGNGAILSATRMTLTDGQANIDGAVDAVIYVGDSSADPTTGVPVVLGYHSENFGQLPYGFIYLDVCAQNGDAWSGTLSHEVLELLGDPTAAMTVAGPAPAGVGNPGDTVAYDLEVCDPTQSDTYMINNVTVSNFVTKAYFGMIGPSSATNFLKLTLDPFGVRPNGYFQYEADGAAHQIDGEKVTEGRLAARALLGSYRRNARRKTALKHRI